MDLSDLSSIDSAPLPDADLDVSSGDDGARVEPLTLLKSDADKSLKKDKSFQRHQFKRAKVFDKVLRGQTAHGELKDQFDKTCAYWNTTRLRVGEFIGLNRASCVADKPKAKGHSYHPNAWTVHGVLRLAFGSLSQGQSEFSRQTAHKHECLAAVALAHEARQSQHVKQFTMSIESKSIKPPWVWLDRAWDSTPVTLRFGIQHDILRHVATYWYRDLETASKHSSASNGSGWRKLSYDEFMKRGTGKEPTSGCLHLMAQTGCIMWPEPLVDGRHKMRNETLIFPPTFFGTSNSSVVFQCLKQALAFLSWEAIQNMTYHVPFFVLSLRGDLDSANVRCKMKYAGCIVEHNQFAAESQACGYVAMIDGICLAHVLHRMVELTMELTTLLCKLHATAFTFAQTRAFNALMLCLKKLIEQDLEVGYYPGQVPPAHFSHHTKNIIRITLLRHRHTRGRNELESPLLESKVDQFAKDFVRYANGDLKASFYQHYCFGDCCDRQRKEVCVNRSHAIFGHMLESVGQILPANSEWWTVAPTLTAQGMGLFCHGMLRRVVAMARDILVEDRNANEQLDQLDAWAQATNGKLNTSVDFLTQEDSAVTVFVALLVMEPIDLLTAQLQHLDFHKHTISTMLTAVSPLKICAKSYLTMLEPLSQSTSTLLKHFSGLDEEFVYFRLFDSALALAAQFWDRILNLLGSWPWKLLEGNTITEDGRKVLQYFFDADGCDLDQCFSEPLRMACPSLEDMSEEKWGLLIACLQRHLKLTNMGLESLLAEMKAAALQKKGKATVETQSYAGVLTQLFKDHMAMGNPNPLKEDRETLKARGLPLMPLRNQRLRPDKKAPHLSYANKQMHMWEKRHPRATYQEKRDQICFFFFSPAVETKPSTSASKRSHAGCWSDTDGNSHQFTGVQSWP